MRFNIYCDESCTDSQRYFVIGSIWVSDPLDLTLRQAIATVRRDHHMPHHFKWTRVNASKLPGYKALVDAFFGISGIKYRCMVVDTRLADARTHHHNDRELMFYKFYHFLLRYSLIGAQEYYVYLHRRPDQQINRQGMLQDTLNHWCCGEGMGNPVRLVAAVSAEEEELVLLTDVISGAVGARWNAHPTGTAKSELAEYIARRVGLSDLSLPTKPTATPLNIWKWRPATTKKQIRPGS